MHFTGRRRVLLLVHRISHAMSKTKQMSGINGVNLIWYLASMCFKTRMNMKFSTSGGHHGSFFFSSATKDTGVMLIFLKHTDPLGYVTLLVAIRFLAKASSIFVPLLFAKRLLFLDLLRICLKVAMGPLKIF